MEILVSDFFKSMEDQLFVEALAEILAVRNRVLFIPTSKDVQQSMKYLEKTMNAFQAANIFFEEAVLYDNTDEKLDFTSFSCVFLMGGSLTNQNELLHNDSELTAFLKKTEIPLIGFSAGALNLGETIFINPDHQEELTTGAKGIGRYDFLIDVHVAHELKDTKVYAEIEKDLFLLTDGAGLIHDNQQMTFFGKVFLLKS
ncbi:peptidase E [Enterococcus sp. PF1-24]|uniref:Type 1 glutamine amidotransferase-like domain-containing protein n=1 Tax=unclassified Enterococcus TaxID=2608891 RepID=UPI00247539C8|nr:MULTISPECIES: Type 1 glutamine amidotransferase-like domain-containing protein [unclassified Enterococcus]MDH6363413.1 peptidase E [Enterococcus sp. PFB1-1]MDH6400507.1 peptidase E [Enterococcus sp. PF1-24]